MNNSLESIKIVDQSRNSEVDVLINPDQSFFELLASAKRIKTNLFEGEIELKYRNPSNNRWVKVGKSEPLEQYVNKGVFTFYSYKPSPFHFFKNQSKKNASIYSDRYFSAKSNYATVSKRLIALIIDFFIITIISGLAVSVLKLPSIIFGSYLVLGWLYFAIMESSRTRATLGKKMMGLYVTDQFGRQLTFGVASLRYFSKFISAMPAFIGFMIAWVTPKKQACHDLLAGTLVIDSQSFQLKQNF